MDSCILYLVTHSGVYVLFFFILSLTQLSSFARKFVIDYQKCVIAIDIAVLISNVVYLYKKQGQTVHMLKLFWIYIPLARLYIYIFI